MRRIPSLLLTVAVMAAACGTGDSAAPTGDDAAPSSVASAGAPATTAAPTTVAPTTTPAPTTTLASTTTEAPRVWREVVADDCQCADGSPYRYWVRDGDPDRVMLFFGGGGACFSAATCDIDGDPSFTPDASIDANQERTQGIFDITNPTNPVREWTHIYLPYCTGDLHLGTRVHDYGDGVIINHSGFANAQKGVDEILANHAGAEQILVAGWSAGGVPVPLFAGHLADALPDAEILGLTDSAGGYPTDPTLNTFVGGLWGTLGAVPDWSSTAGLDPVDWGIPELYVYAGQEFPRIRWARHDVAFDNQQTAFSVLAGLEDPSVKAVLDTNEALVEAAGVDLPVYVPPGDSHAILGFDLFYEREVEGVAFIDWVADFIAGEPIDDVVCEDCRPPG